MENARNYCIGGITINVDSDVPIMQDTFDEKFRHFQTDGPGEDTVYLYHHMGIPFLDVSELGEEIYHKPPWTIYKRNDDLVYVLSPDKSIDNGLDTVAVFSHNYNRGDIYHKRADIFNDKYYHSLTLFPSDQLIVAQLLSNREGVMLHSGAVILGGAGLMFVGHSSAGKSTTIKLLNNKAEVLCDDRNIIRRHPGGYRLYGTWSHGELPQVSSSSAPLKAILFLKQSQNNRLVHLKDRREIRLRLLACLIKPFLTAGWWDKSLALVEDIANQVPCYEMEFDKSGDIVPVLEELVKGD